MADAAALDLAIRQIQFARDYLLELIEDVEQTDWFTMPAGSPSHLAWHVGHLAMAEYGLCLFRQRGRQPIDSELMTSKFRKRFSRGSTPEPDASSYPSVAEIRTVLDAVHQQALQEMPTFSLASLDDGIDRPYAAFSTKLGALLFCSHHEMLHAGQIGVLRRMLGKDPLR